MGTFRAIKIDTDGTVAEHQWDAAEQSLGHLQGAVGGYVDVVALAPDLDMWLNDEGLINGSGINPVATALAREQGMTHQPYAGTVVLTGGCDQSGATLPLTPERLESLLTRCQALATAM